MINADYDLPRSNPAEGYPDTLINQKQKHNKNKQPLTTS
jgi:hypothetical protein